MTAASSSSPFFGNIRDDDHFNHLKQQQMVPVLPSVLSMPSSSSSSAIALPTGAGLQVSTPVKKKRNLPGNPNPDAEVIALSPKTLMATNRFICEVCNKGFQREQNLQLHRRGHNLPWKLKQKSNKEVRRRVYLCPELNCVHHDPSRALGDLTGIKKHFCRKHGEKKWKCDKCSKRYAVQSDWKAHSKTCGTREYRCDCGTLFSRRDSFITHRAFCDALAQESARLPSGLSGIGNHLYGGGGINLSAHSSGADLLRLGAGGSSAAGAQFDHLISPSFRPPNSTPSSAYFLPDESHPSHQPFLMPLPDIHHNSAGSSAPVNLFNLSFFPNGGSVTNNSGNQAGHHMMMMQEQFHSSHGAGGEPACLYDQMGGSMQALFSSQMQSGGGDSVLPQMSATALLQKAAQMGATSSSSTKQHSLRTQMDSENHLQDIMNSFANGSTVMFGRGSEQEAKFDDFNGGFGNIDEGSYQQSNGLTRDFLGVGGMMRSMGGGRGAQREHGVIGVAGPSDVEMKPASSGRPFSGGSLR